MRWLKLVISFTLFACAQAYGLTLEELLRELPATPPSQLEEKIRKLPQEERLKLEVLLNLYSGNEKRALELLKRIRKNLLVANVLYLPEDLYGIVVDKTNENLFVIRVKDGVPEVVREFRCITGKRPGDKLKEGDMRTPEGIYFPLYWKGNLSGIYGIGAFPLNYPNLIDRKVLKRNGHGIWIHGTDDPNRPPHSTNGCIALRNKDLEELKKYVTVKRTPVVIVSELKFQDKKDILNEEESLKAFVEKWRKAWEETPKDITPYLNCYSEKFVWERGNYEDWVRYKKRVTRWKRWIKVKVSDLTLTRDGRLLSFGNLYVVRLKVDYRSNNFDSRVNKVLYVIKENGKWKILGEENL